VRKVGIISIGSAAVAALSPLRSIVDANHRVDCGDGDGGVRVADFENELPVIDLR